MVNLMIRLVNLLGQSRIDYTGPRIVFPLSLSWLSAYLLLLEDRPFCLCGPLVGETNMLLRQPKL
jgi:hypothetical protein